MPAFFAGVGIGGLVRPRGQRRCVPQHEQVFAAVDARERLRRDAREHLPGLALECGHARDREPRRIGAVDARGDEDVALADVRVGRHEAKLRQTAGAGAEEHAAHAAALDLDRHRMVLVGDERHFRHERQHARHLPHHPLRVDDRVAGVEIRIRPLVDEELLRERIAAGVEHLDDRRRAAVARAQVEQRLEPCVLAARARLAPAQPEPCSTRRRFSASFSPASSRCVDEIAADVRDRLARAPAPRAAADRARSRPRCRMFSR